MRIVIASKTRMRAGRICVGAHDLETFRSLRLFRHDNTYIEETAGLEIGDLWEVVYRDRPHIDAPHLEDVIVSEEGARRYGTEPDLAKLIQEHDVVWTSVEELFDGCLEFTDSGTAYVPVGGRLPDRSTGYWRTDAPLERYIAYERTRYRWHGGGALRTVAYVGVGEPADVVPEGNLVRLSLSHANQPPNRPNGYWLQLSGWYEN
jgi:hypothetical protein